MVYSTRSMLFIVLATVVVGCLGCNSSNRANGQHGGRDEKPTALFSADIAERQKEYGAKTGDVQASLLWNNYNDLDLHVVDPSGEHIYFAHRRAQSGGELDVDMNADGPESDKPVENIYFPRGSAPPGRYRVLVNYYADHGSADPTAFRCEVLVGARIHKFSGALSDGDLIRLVYEFTLGERETPSRPSPQRYYRLFSPVPSHQLRRR